MKQEEQQEKVEQVSWSADDEVSKHILELIRFVDEKFIEKDFENSVAGMISIKNLIVASLNEDERGALQTLEKNMQMSLTAQSMSKNRDDWEGTINLSDDMENRVKQFMEKHLPKLKDQSSAYRLQLMIVLDRYGYLVKKAKDKTKMKF